MRLLRRAPAADTHHALACADCGQLPEPARARRTLALVLAVLPVELAVHAAVVQLHLALPLKVLLLTVLATVLAVWVAEPSAARVLRRYLHAPQLRRHHEAARAEALWRVRFRIPDRAGALERVTHELAVVGANILVIHVHPLGPGPGGHQVLDELVLATPSSLDEEDLLAALQTAGTREAQVSRTTPVALADAQTRSLGLAARIAAEPESLPAALAELLDARVAMSDGGTGPGGPDGAQAPAGADDAGPQAHAGSAAEGTLLRLPTASGVPLLVHRPGQPFTPAESARAHRLAELAEAVELGRARNGAY